MILNYIWVAFFLIALVVSLARFGGYFLQQVFDITLWRVFDAADRDVFHTIVQSTFSMAETSITISIYLIGIMTLWLGLMKIGEKGGAVGMMSKVISPFFVKVFPEVPKNHPAMGSILMNFCANMLGLDNAATPFGLKAMKELQTLNPKEDTATNAQIMFLVLNTCGLTIIPISIIAMRAATGAENPADVFLPLLLSTFFATLTGLITVSIFQRINLINWAVILYVGVISFLIVLLLIYVRNLTQGQLSSFSVIAGNFILFGFIMFFIITGLKAKLPLYETFIEGAKEGFEVAVKIIPYLVAMLVAIGVFRASGAFSFIIGGIATIITFMGFDTRFVDALPVALMKPLSGSGARGLMIDTMKAFGPDSFAGRLGCIFQGSTETTFYTVAVYYGSVNIRKTRYTVTCGLIADLAGIIAAIFWAYTFFG